MNVKRISHQSSSRKRVIESLAALNAMVMSTSAMFDWGGAVIALRKSAFLNATTGLQALVQQYLLFLSSPALAG